MSVVFQPYRALGVVTNNVPASLQTRGAEHFITTCVGRAFHTYNCKKLHLLFVSPKHDQDISSLVTHKDNVFTAAGKKIFGWKRAKLVKEYKGHTKDVVGLLPFGEHLISYSEDKTVMVHDIGTGEEYCSFTFSDHITAVIHPATYLNKVLFGTTGGKLELWNIKSAKMVHQFTGWSSAVTAMCQSPAVDVIAIGLQCGTIIIHDIKFDESLMKFHQDWGVVTTLSFRTDGEPILVSGSAEGHLAMWDMEQQESKGTLHEAHRGSISTAQFLSSQPVLVTTGADNSVKMWVFDGPGGTGRVLRQREGHSAPPCIVRFYGNPAHTILSAGHDKAVRMFSTIRDARSKEMSQGHVESKAKRLNISGDALRLGPVIALAAEEIREREWANVITAHLHNSKVRTWNTVKGALDSVVLNAKVEPVSPASAVALTTCGNISFVGYNAGHLASYNIQSGNLRGLFCRSGNYAHKGKVTGIETDNINMNVLSVGLDKHLRVWDLTTRKHVKELELPEPAVKTCIQRDSNLLAIALITFDVVVVDLDTMKVVRTFTGQSNTITDMCFSGNGKWLVLSSMDGSVRVWDLPTGRLIDCFCADSPVTSLTLTPTGEYLATTHVDQNGIFLWCNKTLYGHVNLKPLPNDAQPKEVMMPLSEVAEGVETDEEELEEGEDEEEIDMEWKSRDQLDKQLITLSDVPKSRWNTLCNLDIIKKRNKPREPPKAPKAAPFFLGTTRELVPKFIVEEDTIPEQKVSSKVMKMSSSQTPFQRALLAAVDQGQVEGVIKMMEDMTPSALDVELQTMSPEDGGSEELVSAFVSLLTLCLEGRRDYDVVQAYLNVFIKHNRAYLCSTVAIQDQLRTLKALHTATWTEIQGQLQKCLCVSQYIKNATL